jgi:hypothetical protein
MSNIYLQSEPHWTTEYALAVFFAKAKLKPVPLSKMIPISYIGNAINLKHLFASVDVLIPPSGTALFYPKQIVSFVRKANLEQLKKAKREVLRMLKLYSLRI